MIAYRTPSGRRFVLGRVTPGEWADAIGAALRSVGCSASYAEAVADEYRRAIPA